ncbi:acyltransferase family protein [Streptomyces melanogenes]|uniref:acyltransferase family protein n=1 Tax=Streptomyces melanogenes TaxID=67326 RepID=UPI00167ED5AA|nr:acyltransferase [Streptomyces melanogenes]GGP86264.1 hypothetical protein GCM10010278_75800 [Streptomyces melanogenes]
MTLPLTSLDAAPKARTGRTASGRIRSIDGLRAVAVLAVMSFHFGSGPSGGFLGVDLFFVISGFVITRLLLTQKEAGTLSMRAFYAARVRRLLPALLTVLAAVQLWLWRADLPGLRTTANAQTLASLGFAGNWYAVFAQVDYWSVQPAQAPLNHLWSLAVEEQFYLVWPALILIGAALVAARGSADGAQGGVLRRVLMATTACVALVSYALAQHLYVPGAPDRAYLGTDTRAGALCLGAFAACLLPSSAHGRPRVAGPRALSARAGAALFALAAVWTQTSMDQQAFYAWQLPLVGVAGAVLLHSLAALDQHPAIAATGGPAAALPLPARLIASRPLVAVGGISYGLYLWHWPVWVCLNATVPQWSQPVRCGLAWAASFALAAVSYVLIEAPARRCSFKRLAPVVALAYVMAAAAAGGALLAGVGPEHPADDGTPVVTGDVNG